MIEQGKYECEFDVPSDEVDLERIANECGNIPAVTCLLYLNKLKEKAPIVFERLKKWAKEENRMSYYDWDSKNLAPTQ